MLQLIGNEIFLYNRQIGMKLITLITNDIKENLVMIYGLEALQHNADHEQDDKNLS